MYTNNNNNRYLGGEFAGMQVLVCGIAKSGVSAAALLKRLGANVTISDMKEREKIEDEATFLERMGIKLFLGRNPDEIVGEFRLVVISPGIPFDLPFLEKARELDIPVWGEIELASMLCKASIIGITGTNGKTTTTALTGEILTAYNPQTYVVGNIGTPFCDKVLQTDEQSFVVAEISSFQLETVHTFRPFISCVLNITPDHLNRHKTLECYTQTKEKIFANQGPEDYTLLNYDDEACRKMTEKTNSKVMLFSTKDTLDQGVFIQNEHIYIKWDALDEAVIHRNQLQMPGAHIEDALAAVGIAVCAGVPLPVIRKALKNFKSVEHRIEFVRSIRAVDFYNDSKATNTDAAIKALQTMGKPVILIGGGKDKAANYGDWVKEFNGKVKFLAVLGETADAIVETCKAYSFFDYHKVNTLKDAVELCFSRAEAGDCILLSPACASFDMFDSYEQRGRVFKEFVHGLKEE